jgi:2-aminobenzoate-CoA ligase
MSPPVDRRPPRELWPDRIYPLPGLVFGDTLNLATELVDRQVRRGLGARPAVIQGDRRITYAELQNEVNRIGNALGGLGVGPGDRVMLRMPNRPAFVASWLALQKIGAVAVATMPMLRARELAYVLRDAEVKAALVADDLAAELVKALEETSARPAIVLTGNRRGAAETGHPLDDRPRLADLMAASAPDLDPHPSGRDDLAMIAYTSGSTGVPKGACHSHVDLLASAESYARHILAPVPDDVFGGHATLAFTYGLGAGLVFPLRFGAATSLLEGFTPERMLSTVEHTRITLLFCAATTYKLFLQIPGLESRYDLRSLRLCVSAGEPLPRPVYEEWLRRTGIEVLDCLGTTEMFHVFVCQRPGAVRPGATGLPVPGYQIRIVDERFEDVPRGTPGLIAVKGPTGCRYWGKPDWQRDYVRGGWNVPNDVCVEDEHGYVWYHCRNDDLIVSAGYNIAGPEVEAVLLEHAAVLEAAVVASPDETRGQVPKAFVVLKPGVEPTGDLAAELQEYVKAQLAPYKYPRSVEFLEALPKTETGKIRRVELRQREFGNDVASS